MTSTDSPLNTSGRDMLGFALGFVGVVIFGGTLPMTRIAVGTFDPWFVTFGRAAIASVPAFLLLALLRRPFPPRHAWRSLAIAMACAVVGFPLFTAVAMQTVPASHGGVVLGLLPLATTVAAVFVNGERPSPAFWLFGLAGAGILVAFTFRSAEGGIGTGDLALVGAAACSAIGYAHFARIAGSVPGWEAISWALVISFPMTAAVTFASFEPAYWNAPREAVLSLLYVAFFSVFIGFFFWNAGLAIGGVSRVGQVQLLQTFVTIAMASALIGETVSLETIGYAVAVVVVVLAARRQTVTRPHT